MCPVETIKGQEKENRKATHWKSKRIVRNLAEWFPTNFKEYPNSLSGLCDLSYGLSASCLGFFDSKVPSC
jgi:hypothetical protein